MARYYGTLQGARGPASRLGHASSGLVVEACSWQGKVRVVAEPDHRVPEHDKVRISAQRHGSSSNPVGTIFDGTFKELGELINWWQQRDQIRAVLALMNDKQLARLTEKEQR